MPSITLHLPHPLPQRLRRAAELRRHRLQHREAHAEAWASRCSSTIRTARSRTSGENRLGRPIDPILPSNEVSEKPGTIHERAATAAACFNHRQLRDFDVIELQADARCTFIGSKRRTLWLFATIEVCSRLWAGSVLGRRSHRNTKAAINDVILRGRRVGCPLIATDGVEYYVGVMVRLLGSACVYGQVLKTRRNNRVVRVERRMKIGTASRLNAALLASEDAETLNTSFIERLNLTIRQGSAYLRRRSPCHARGADQLRGHVELLRCYYHFIRPHRALRFGRETRTPAMQAGLVSQRLALRDIFTAGGLTRRIFVAVVHVSVTVQPTESDEAELSTRCSPSARRQAA